MLTAVYFAIVMFSGHAQQTREAIVIEDVHVRIEGENLELSFQINASELELNCDGQLKLEFAIEHADRRLVLPAVIYSGTRRYHYEQRRMELSGTYYAEPYKIYRGIRKHGRYELGYVLTIPYYTWMEHASITFREYRHDCSGGHLTDGGVLVSDLNPAPAYVEPEVWAPNKALPANPVSFLVPEVEEVKLRTSIIELNIDFPANVTEVRPEFSNNAYELLRADSLIDMLQRNDLITISGIAIRGYASPEGRYEVNERLARGRSEGFKRYLVNKYPTNTYVRNAITSWVAEDWEGLVKLIEASELADNQEVMAVVGDNSMAPDAREQALQQIIRWSYVYKPLLKEMYPKLRRIELRVDYTINTPPAE